MKKTSDKKRIKDGKNVEHKSPTEPSSRVIIAENYSHRKVSLGFDLLCHSDDYLINIGMK